MDFIKIINQPHSISYYTKPSCIRSPPISLYHLAHYKTHSHPRPTLSKLNISFKWLCTRPAGQRYPDSISLFDSAYAGSLYSKNTKPSSIASQRHGIVQRSNSLKDSFGIYRLEKSHPQSLPTILITWFITSFKFLIIVPMLIHHNAPTQVRGMVIP